MGIIAGQVAPASVQATVPVPAPVTSRVSETALAQLPLLGYAHWVSDAAEQLPAQAVPAPEQASRPPCGSPLVTGEQVPCEPATSHAWHCPAQVSLQQ
jgi:hypothetical protein